MESTSTPARSASAGKPNTPRRTRVFPGAESVAQPAHLPGCSPPGLVAVPEHCRPAGPAASPQPQVRRSTALPGGPRNGEFSNRVRTVARRLSRGQRLRLGLARSHPSRQDQGKSQPGPSRFFPWAPAVRRFSFTVSGLWRKSANNHMKRTARVPLLGPRWLAGPWLKGTSTMQLREPRSHCSRCSRRDCGIAGTARHSEPPAPLNRFFGLNGR